MTAALVLAQYVSAAPSSSGAAVDAGTTEPVSGMALYQAHCAACHDGQVPRAPHMITFTMGADSLLNAMNNGAMRAQAAALSVTEREVLAGFLAGEAMAAPKPILACTEPMGALLANDASAMQGWGGNARNQSVLSRHFGGLHRGNVEQLSLKWVFAYPGALRRPQPLVHDGVVFVGSQSGEIYALDLESGCAHWTHSAGAEVRSSLSSASCRGMTIQCSTWATLVRQFMRSTHGMARLYGARLWGITPTRRSQVPQSSMTGVSTSPFPHQSGRLRRIRVTPAVLFEAVSSR